MNLEEEFEHRAEIGSGRIEDNFNRLGMTAVFAVRGVRHVAARITYPRRDYAGQPTDQILHAPEAPPASTARCVMVGAASI